MGGQVKADPITGTAIPWHEWQRLDPVDAQLLLEDRQRREAYSAYQKIMSNLLPVMLFGAGGVNYPSTFGITDREWGSLVGLARSGDPFAGAILSQVVPAFNIPNPLLGLYARRRRGW